MQNIPSVKISGSPYQIGETLGRMSQAILAKQIYSDDFQSGIESWRSQTDVKAISEITMQYFPDCWDELRGMSKGAGISIEDILLWNCRPEILHSTFSQSTTLAINRLSGRFIIHDIYESAANRPYCYLADIKPFNKPGFKSFYSPGMLPGYAFSTSYAGLVQTVNMLDCPIGQIGIPSTVLARGILDVSSLPEAVDILMSVPRAGSSHHILAWVGEFIMLSIEGTSHQSTVMPISSKFSHANHSIHPEQAKLAPSASPASRKRYISALEQLNIFPEHPSEKDIISWLRSSYGDAELPGKDQQEAIDHPFIKVFFRCKSSDIAIDVFHPGSSASQRHSFTVNAPPQSS